MALNLDVAFLLSVSIYHNRTQRHVIINVYFIICGGLKMLIYNIVPFNLFSKMTFSNMKI